MTSLVLSRRSVLTTLATAAAVAICFAAVRLPAAEPESGQKAPALVVKDLKGASFDLSSQVKKGPAFVNFWATWCIPCREEMPLISKLSREAKHKRVAFISVAMKDKEAAVKKFVAQSRPAHRIALDKGDKAYNAWDIRAVPVSFLVGKDGKVLKVYDQFDSSDLAAIRADIAKALAAYK